MCPINQPLPKRILIYGTTGSGKSTLATRLAEITGRKCVLVDDLTWGPNWTAMAPEAQRELMSAIAQEDSWVIDSAYAIWLDLVLPRTELVIGLDYPPPFIFFRLLRRTILRCWDKRPICNGNHETLKGMFSKKSILLWFFKSYKRKRARLRQWEAGDGPPVLRFSRASQTEAWLRSLR